MKIQEIKPAIVFEAKKLPKDLTKDMVMLKENMEADTFVQQTRLSDRSVKVRALGIDGEAIFRDGHYFAKKTQQNVYIRYGNDISMLDFGKVRLIANSNGELVEYKKPFYKTWASVFQKAQYYVTRALNNYDDSLIVTKQLYKNQKFTSREKQMFNFIKTLIRMNPWSK